MSHARFYVEELSSGKVTLSAAESGHARKSRRLKLGDIVALFDGKGCEATGAIVSIERKAVVVEVSDVRSEGRFPPELVLAVALPKGPRQDVLIEKCTELGVAGIWPIVTERSVSSASDHKLSKWRRSMVEAAKQSEQCWLPEVLPPMSLEQVSQTFSQEDRVLLATTDLPDQQTVRMGDALTGEYTRVIALIGPEGGWAVSETELLLRAGAIPVTLGPHTLRIETAAIAMASVVHAIRR